MWDEELAATCQSLLGDLESKQGIFEELSKDKRLRYYAHSFAETAFVSITNRTPINERTQYDPKIILHSKAVLDNIAFSGMRESMRKEETYFTLLALRISLYYFAKKKHSLISFSTDKHNYSTEYLKEIWDDLNEILDYCKQTIKLTTDKDVSGVVTAREHFLLYQDSRTISEKILTIVKLLRYKTEKQIISDKKFIEYNQDWLSYCDKVLELVDNPDSMCTNIPAVKGYAHGDAEKAITNLKITKPILCNYNDLLHHAESKLKFLPYLTETTKTKETEYNLHDSSRKSLIELLRAKDAQTTENWDKLVFHCEEMLKIYPDLPEGTIEEGENFYNHDSAARGSLESAKRFHRDQGKHKPALKRLTNGLYHANMAYNLTDLLVDDEKLPRKFWCAVRASNIYFEKYKILKDPLDFALALLYVTLSFKLDILAFKLKKIKASMAQTEDDIIRLERDIEKWRWSRKRSIRKFVRKIKDINQLYDHEKKEIILYLESWNGIKLKRTKDKTIPFDISEYLEIIKDVAKRDDVDSDTLDELEENLKMVLEETKD